MRGALVVLLLALAGGVAGADSLVGQEAPALGAVVWMAAPEGDSLAALNGRVLVLLSSGACDLADTEAVLRWNDLRAAYFELGLRVLVVVPTKPPEELLASVGFSVAVGSADAYGGASRAVLIDAAGQVAWQGEPDALPEDLLAKLLHKTKAFALRALDPAVKDAAQAFKRGQLVQARELARTVDHADARHIEDRVAALLDYWHRQYERARAAADVAEQVVLLTWLSTHDAGESEANAAAHQLKQLKADPTNSKELSAAATYVRLRAELLKTDGKPKRVAALVKKGERFAERYAGTRGAARAERMIAALKADPAVAALQAFIAKEKIDTRGSAWRTRLPRPPLVAFAKDREYLWSLETSEGAITLRLFPAAAPMHVSSLIYLTTLGFFDGLIFHRVIPGFMAQGGCPAGSGSGDPGYKFDGEFDEGRKHDRPGILSAAHAGPGTDGSQFFITFAPAPHLDGKHTVYGEVVSGTKTLQRLEKLGTAGGSPTKRITIEKATIGVE